MNFIDHTGHIFSLPSYSSFPAGYEYDEQQYIFWLNETNKLSVNNYYIKPIRILLDDKYVITNDSEIQLSIKLESNNYKLLGSYHINNFINQSKNIFDYITISSDRKYWDGSNYDTISSEQKQGYVEFDLLKDELTENDVICVTNLVQDTEINGTIVTNTFSMITFYVVGYSEEEQVLLSNILITLYNSGRYEYCPITVGGEFMDECEPLVINGKNMGINIPKTIIRAFYETSFYNYNADEVIYNNKLKELLFNYMGIKGECGNYDSAIKSLKWFGWGDKITLSKLVQTDNEFINQYIIDKFDINNDTLSTFKHFTNTTFIRLSIAGTQLSDETNEQEIVLDSDLSDDIFTWGDPNQINNIHDTFWGEGKPKIVNLINDIVPNTYDEGDIKFYKPYYNYLFQELGLKLAALEYFYRKYFLPIHLFIHSSTITHQCFMNDTKMLVGENKSFFTANPVINYDLHSNISVEFPHNNFLMYYTQQHIIDKNYNEFKHYIINVEELTETMDLYWVNENCLSIPIKFSQNTENDREYYRCKLVLEKLDKVLYDYEYSFTEEPISNKMYNNFTKTLKNTGSLLYDLIHYDDIIMLNCIDVNNEKVDDIIISHQKFTQIYETQTLELSDEWDEYRTFNQFKQYIKENYLNFLVFGQDLPYFNIKIKTPKYLKHIYCGNNDLIRLSNVSIVDDVHTLVYESAFDFIQYKSKPETHYNKFIIIPKIINKEYDINFWLNSEFNIYLSVNGQWFTYNFNCRVPEFQINLGKLKYKYYLDSTETFEAQHGNVSLFKQLSYLDENTIKFNTFMWQPDFVRVNNIDFFDNLLEYYKNNKYNVLYNEDSKTLLTDIELKDSDKNIDINDDDVYYILQINNQKIYIHINVIQQYLLKLHNKFIALDVEMLTKENRENPIFVYYSTADESVNYKYIFNETVEDTEEYIGSSGSMNISEEYENFLFTGEDAITYSFNGIGELESNIINNSLEDNFIFVYEDEFINSGNKYIIVYLELNTDNTIRFYIKTLLGNKYYLQIFKSIYKNKTYLYNKYKEIPNIINNKEYINKVHQYYIYKNNSSEMLKYNPANELEVKQYEIDLYNKFFNKDEQFTSRINIPKGEEIYDFYLMHDSEYWYALFITKLPINKYLYNELDITDDKKEIIYTDYIHQIGVDKISNEQGVSLNYSNINYEILENVKQQTGLQNSDLLIVYNTTDDIYDNNNTVTDTIKEDITQTEYFNRYLINKIYNKNIGKRINNIYSDDEADIVWNEEPNTENNYIGVNWISIPLENVVCPKCGKSEYFTNIKINENTNTFICTNIIGYNGEEPIYCNYEYTKSSNSILHWNDLGIPYKMVYSIVDDIYNEETNPTGKYHEEQLFKYDKYMFSMNNTPYYMIYNETENSYCLGNNVLGDNTGYYTVYSKTNKRPVYSYSYNGIEIPSIKYDDTIFAYKGNIVELTSITDTPEYYTIVEGLHYNDVYYTYINDVIIYTKNDVEDIVQNNNFYLLYDGSYVYEGAWDLSINVSSDSLDINDIIKIYSMETNDELQWVVNPQYNFKPYNPDTLGGVYVYKMVESENGFYIKKDLNTIKYNDIVYIKLSSVTVSNNVIYIKTQLPLTTVNGVHSINIKKLFIDYIGIYTYNNDTDEYSRVTDENDIQNQYIYIKVYNVFWNIGIYNSFIDNEKLVLDNIYTINTTDYIEFDENQRPKQYIFVDNTGQFFTLKNYYDEDREKYIFRKQLVTRETIAFVVDTVEGGTLYNAISDTYYEPNYYNQKTPTETEMVIHNNYNWLLNNYGRLGLGLNEFDTEFSNKWVFDNLWYYIPTTSSISDVTKQGWEILIYINEQIKHKNTEWYFTINGHEYKLNDMLPVGTNIKATDIDNKANIYGVNIKLSDYNLDPMYVELTLIPGTTYREMYYDMVDFYYFKYNKSDEKFLINRMDFEPTNGKNHFSTNDIIGASLINNMSKDGVNYKIEFKLDYGSKWNFVPVSLKMKHDTSIVSNSDLAIMSIGDSNIKYERGYYDLTVNYSIEGNTQNIQTLKSRILVK